MKSHFESVFLTKVWPPKLPGSPCYLLRVQFNVSSNHPRSSRATTPGLPGPTAADAQARVMSLLQRGQLNSAFQQALSASDLGLVVLVCENTDPAQVFSCSMGPGQGSRCVLQQPVLLSLVQQLSANLGHRTELKHRWECCRRRRLRGCVDDWLCGWDGVFEFVGTWEKGFGRQGWKNRGFLLDHKNWIYLV